jgi:hypothetical protein
MPTARKTSTRARALQALLFLSAASSCGGSGATESVVVRVASTPDSVGGGFTVGSVHYQNCDALCAEQFESETIVSCEGPVPVDPTTGTATFEPGGPPVDVAAPSDIVGPAGEAIRCYVAYHDATGCGNLPQTGLSAVPSSSRRGVRARGA